MHTPERRAEAAYPANFAIPRRNHLAWQCFAPDEFGRTRKHHAWTSKYSTTCPQNSASHFPGSYQPLIPFQTIKESHFSCGVHQKMNLSRDLPTWLSKEIIWKKNSLLFIATSACSSFSSKAKEIQHIQYQINQFCFLIWPSSFILGSPIFYSYFQLKL